VGISVIFYVCLLFLLTSILGAIVLAVIPGFRITIPNLLVFVIGAIPGMAGLTNLVVRELIDPNTLNHLSVGQQDALTYALAFFGALIGGTILVWLKIHLLKALDKLARPRHSSALK
jgi:hypothetical protein